MNKITVFLTVVIMALSFVLGTTMQSKAQNKTFTGVMPFVTNNDRVGFWDQTSGRVYVYDNNLQNCLFIGQMQGLGQPIQEITAQNQSNNVVTNTASNGASHW